MCVSTRPTTTEGRLAGPSGVLPKVTSSSSICSLNPNGGPESAPPFLQKAFLIRSGNTFVKQELNVDPAIFGPS
jgi:hypothetical protein